MRTIKNKWMLPAAILMLLAATIIIFSKKQQQAAGNDLLPVDLHAFRIADGWGYEVKVDKKVFIHQDCIPAISSYKRFRTEADAMQIGNMVVEKIKQGKKPAISVKEIEESHISY